MNAYPYQPDPAATRAKDESDLNLLSILHYVWSAMLGCSGIGLTGYFIMIAAFVANAPTGSHAPPHAAENQAMAAGVMGVVGIVMGIAFIPLFILHLLAAAGLKKRTRYGLAFAMSCFACLSVPLGTGLGIWTIMVLQRPSVKALFGRA